MARRTILPIVLMVLPATSLLTAQATLDEAMADECRTRPGLIAPRNAHWYYRPNPVNHQRCWFLRTEQMQTRARRARSHVPRELGHRSLRALLKTQAQYDSRLRRTASAQVVAELPNQSFSEPSSRIDFAARWPDLPGSSDSDAHEVMTISYMEKDTATDADAQMQSRHARPQQGEQSLGLVLLPSALAMAVLLLAGAIFKLAREADPRGRWRLNAGRSASGPHGADVEETAGRASSAAARYHASVRRSPRPTAPAYNLTKVSQQVIRDLQRAGVAHYSGQSSTRLFHNGRIGTIVKQEKS